MADENGRPGVGELSRQVQDAVARLNAVATLLETSYVRKDVFESYKEKADIIHEDLRKDVDALNDDKKWLTRTVGALVLALVMAAAVAVGGVRG